jgi:CBS domain-containing protein
MGGALGGLEAQVLNLSDPGLWAMISMAAIMGGTMRSPFTAVVFLLELTHDVNVVPGLLIACTAAHGVTVLLLRRSILTEKVARRGHHVMREYVVSALQRLRVGEVMAVDFVTIPATMTVGELAERLARPDAALDHHPAWPVVDEDDQLVGIVTRGDVFRTIAQPEGKSRTVLEAGSDALLVTYPDELLEDAVVRMIRNDVGRLPVVDRQNDRRVVGYLGRTGVLRALGRRLREEHVLEAGWLSVRLRFLRSRVRHTFRRGGGDGRGLGAEAVGVRSRAEKEAGPRGDRPGRSRG